MKCSGKIFWESPAIGNPDGTWDHEMNCQETGFNLATGREDDWPGIVNVRAKCLGVETEITSSDDLRGEYNRDMECRLPGQQIVGVQVRKKNRTMESQISKFCVLESMKKKNPGLRNFMSLR